MNSERRCGAASILGATVMQGRDATARLADRLALQDEMYAQANRPAAGGHHRSRDPRELRSSE